MYGAFSKIPADTFKNLVTNAGMVLKDFDPASPEIDEEDILGPTQGGNQSSLQYSYIDYGEDIDNCPKNTKELKRTDDVTATASGAFVALNEAAVEWLMAHCDKTTSGGVTKFTPRTEIDIEKDFHDLWIVGDYSDKNTGAGAGFLAIHLKNAFSTGGFQLQTTDKNKATFSYEFTGHFSLDAQDEVPYEVYMKQGAS